MSKSYTNGIIAFLDILGFSNYIEKTKEIDEIQVFFNFVEKICYLYNTSDIHNIKIAFFSDSFVLTTNEKTKDSLSSIFFACHMINIQLYEATKLFTRGAICSGDYYHQNNITFGPGIIKAYREQESNAKFIRLIVERSLVHMIELPISSFIESDEEYVYYCNYFLLETFERITSASKGNIDNLNFELAKPILRKNRQIINDNLAIYRDTNVYEKYEWLITPFNSCCKHFASFNNSDEEFLNLQIL
ncbi:MAG TPA: hypothetical protein VI413_07790 [Paludibacter sp.]